MMRLLGLAIGAIAAEVLARLDPLRPSRRTTSGHDTVASTSTRKEAPCES